MLKVGNWLRSYLLFYELLKLESCFYLYIPKDCKR